MVPAMSLYKQNDRFVQKAYEPSLKEVLAEPMIRELMARDGVKAGQLQQSLDALARAVTAQKMQILKVKQ